MKRKELLLGAALSAIAGPAARAASLGAPAQTIMLIRHAEKPLRAGAAPFGITAGGTQDEHALIVDGWSRAGALVELFAPERTPLRRGLSRPARIFATRPGSANESLRPQETVTPLAVRLRMHVDLSYAFGEEEKLAKGLLAAPGVSLAAWQHQHIFLITQKLGLSHLGVPPVWPGNRFDMVYVFSKGAGGSWRFEQVPQLLLAGDVATPFKLRGEQSGTPD